MEDNHNYIISDSTGKSTTYPVILSDEICEELIAIYLGMVSDWDMIGYEFIDKYTHRLRETLTRMNLLTTYEPPSWMDEDVIQEPELHDRMNYER